MCQLARPFRHSAVQRLRHESFQAGTWCGIEHTALWQASVQASWAAGRQHTADTGTLHVKEGVASKMTAWAGS